MDYLHGWNNEYSLTEQVITFDESREISTGMVFPLNKNGFFYGRGYFQLSQQKEIDKHSFHKPVMLEEVISWWLTNEEGIYLDLTIGGGGHSKKILTHLIGNGRLLGMDQDQEALDFCSKQLSDWKSRITLKHANFRFFKNFLKEQQIKFVDGILLDLGVSSHQIDAFYRGFSFMNDGPLDMRMDRSQKTSAFQIVNSYSESELKRIFKDYGEEKRAAFIAREIVRFRQRQKIDSTKTLAALISKAAHPARINKTLARIFQSIRIELHEELSALKMALESSLDCLKPGARLLVLSYHSLEDKITKKFMKENEKRCTCPPEFPQCICKQEGKLKILSKRAIVASEREVKTNPRARSAKLRIAERL